jgi:hypothetical protein
MFKMVFYAVFSSLAESTIGLAIFSVFSCRFGDRVVTHSETKGIVVSICFVDARCPSSSGVLENSFRSKSSVAIISTGFYHILVFLPQFSVFLIVFLHQHFFSLLVRCITLATETSFQMLLFSSNLLLLVHTFHCHIERLVFQ